MTHTKTDVDTDAPTGDYHERVETRLGKIIGDLCSAALAARSYANAEADDGVVLTIDDAIEAASDHAGGCAQTSDQSAGQEQALTENRPGGRTRQDEREVAHG